jgi:hypothetical protein
MSSIITSWRPKRRNVKYDDKPEGIPEWVYTEALAAKRFYNEEWEFWVWQESQERNVSQAVAEDACIRGFKKALDRISLVYGDAVSKWYISFLDMGDILNKVQHPEYEKITLEGL